MLVDRERISQRAEGVAARDRSFALALIDVDDLKHINDFYSRAIGHTLLTKFAQRIADNIRDSDLLARSDGDEFVLLLEPIESAGQLTSIIHRLVDLLKQPFFVDGFEIFTSASIGVSVCPDHGANYEAVRRNAESALNHASKTSKGGVAFFDMTMGQSVLARMELEQRLRLAIRDRQFCCAFQPKVDIRTHEVIGLEALIRWRNSAGELQAPGEFIPLAVELGLIDDVTHLVLSQIIAAMDQIDDAFGPETMVSINIAAKQAGNVEFMQSFAQVLQATNRPRRFMVEVTEDAFLAKNRFQRAVLPMLRELGVGISIDDFGTGYSSLSVLADITADEIKVDRSFITAIYDRPRSQSVLKAIESLGTALGMTIVAEGVENFKELAYLQAATRIRYAQGYYFARPLVLTDVAGTTGARRELRAVSEARAQPETRGSRGSGAVGERYWRRT